jgi:pimeloyl-ACP methyl ester carboxylesterase
MGRHQIAGRRTDEVNMRHALTIFILVLATAFGALAQNAPGRNIQLTPCEIDAPEPNTKLKLLCGTYEVYENRATRTGRKIPIKIEVFPATGTDKASDPLFYFAGGPGSAASEDAPYVIGDFAKTREHRDLVFIDQRGTGGSNALVCKFFDPKDPQSYLGHWNPPDQVRRCREELESRADLTLYTTDIAMDDIDDVRTALGYDKIDLYGGSYGTRAAQTYIRYHGDHVRAAILHGISLPDQYMPRDFPQHTERALDGVIEECLADKTCHEAFPDLQKDKATVLARLLKGPVETEAYMSDSGPKVKVRLPRDLAAEAIRYMLYETSSASAIPLALHLAATGNFQLLASKALYYRQFIVATGATGMYLSVTCAEDLPFAGRGEGSGANTFLGNYRLIQQREACAEWRQGKLRKDYFSPLRSNVPALIQTGQWDPVTPPLYGERLSKTLPNSIAIVVQSGGHGLNGLDNLGCVDEIMTKFIELGTKRGLDTTCLNTIKRSGFMLRLPD